MKAGCSPSDNHGGISPVVFSSALLYFGKPEANRTRCKGGQTPRLGHGNLGLSRTRMEPGEGGWVGAIFTLSSFCPVESQEPAAQIGRK